MDTHVDDAFLPVEFTELWFHLDRTHEVISTLLDLYAADADLAGTFSSTLPGRAPRGSAEPAWLQRGSSRRGALRTLGASVAPERHGLLRPLGAT
jgi:hypothetical protein